ncbi:MAG TPA: 1,2-phenylacetyl-CoA epoxidase subunit PaaC [Burkholderiaceae bacterium]|nr:1,2-phenylacetyl-CoA epoxidase subunit PaaC [Burkholderiaceae bacterium]
MTASISLQRKPEVQYLLRVGDTALILAQRLAEWCGHAPVLEEDIALANMALDLVGQARALLTHAAALDGSGFDEDQLAFLRDERDYFNATIAELPNGERGGDFAFTVLRNLIVATWAKLLWERLQASSDVEVAAIAGKAVKEARYHQRHAADWVVRLADGTDESRRRIDAALAEIWRFTPELFESDAVDDAAQAAGLGPRRADLHEPWLGEIGAVFDEAGLAIPPASGFRSTGTRGVHSEHMGFILAEMQQLQRSFPGGVW